MSSDVKTWLHANLKIDIDDLLSSCKNSVSGNGYLPITNKNTKQEKK